MNDKQYNDLEGIRRSDLWVINKTPMHFKFNLDHPKEQTEAMLFGSALHKYILETEDFTKEYAVAPPVDRRTKEGKEEYKKFIESSEGLTVITLEQFNQIVDMSAVLINDSSVYDLILGSEHEKVFTTVDEETGIPVKVKADMIYRDKNTGIVTIIDYKTTQSCEERAFLSSAKTYGYQFQAGMYAEIIEANLLEKCNFMFIAQEKTEPYAYRIFYCTKEWVDAGRRKYHELLNLYHDCKVNDNWYGYDICDLLEEVYD